MARYDGLPKQPPRGASHRVISAQTAQHLRRTEITQLEADGWTIERDGKQQPQRSGATPSASSSSLDSKSFAAGRASGITEAKKAEAIRWSNVMLSSEIRGKEHQAAVRLAAMPDASSADILAALKGCASDAGLAQARTAKKQTEIDAMWKRAIERAGV